MRYPEQILEGTFLERPNRFIAHVQINGKTEICHVKNTGRCRELLIPGVKVYLAKGSNPARKTLFDLIAVEKIRNGRKELLINMDSQIPNDAAEEYFRNGPLFPAGTLIRREVRCGNSRFDFQIGEDSDPTYIEVKGVTLEQDGIALFPDAPTQRGVKHVEELTSLVKDGGKGAILFVIQMKEIKLFQPNKVMHREFADALKKAKDAGVQILAMDCIVTPESIRIADPVPVLL